MVLRIIQQTASNAILEVLGHQRVLIMMVKTSQFTVENMKENGINVRTVTQTAVIIRFLVA